MRGEFESSRSEIQRMSDEIAAILKGREIAEWREETDALKDRERLLAPGRRDTGEDRYRRVPNWMP